jgi:hypothetical protein
MLLSLPGTLFNGFSNKFLSHSIAFDVNFHSASQLHFVSHFAAMSSCLVACYLIALQLRFHVVFVVDL